MDEICTNTKLVPWSTLKEVRLIVKIAYGIAPVNRTGAQYRLY